MTVKPALSPLAPKTTPTLPRIAGVKLGAARSRRALQRPRRHDAGGAAGRRHHRGRPDPLQDAARRRSTGAARTWRAARCAPSSSMPATPMPSPARPATRRSRRARAPSPRRWAARATRSSWPRPASSASRSTGRRSPPSCRRLIKARARGRLGRGAAAIMTTDTFPKVATARPRSASKPSPSTASPRARA